MSPPPNSAGARIATSVRPPTRRSTSAKGQLKPVGPHHCLTRSGSLHARHACAGETGKVRLTTTSNVLLTYSSISDKLALLGLVVGRSTNPVWRADPLIHQMSPHAVRRMLEMVAMIEPDSGIHGHERDVVPLAVEHVQRVDPPRAARRGDAVAREHDGVMSVQMHGMHLAAVIVDMHDHDVAITNHIHRHIGIEVPVDRPPQTGPAPYESWPPADRVVETPVRLGWGEAQRRRE